MTVQMPVSNLPVRDDRRINCLKCSSLSFAREKSCLLLRLVGRLPAGQGQISGRINGS